MCFLWLDKATLAQKLNFFGRKPENQVPKIFCESGFSIDFIKLAKTLVFVGKNRKPVLR